MRLIAVLLVLVLSACAINPPAPGCSDLKFCEEVATHKVKKGIDARYTVQNMLQTTLIGGVPADPGEWPASVKADSSTGACSATVVADRAVFMAAHRMNNGTEISFNVHANGYKATCVHHPEYAKNARADWAMCFIDRPVTGINFEVLGVGESLTEGEEVLLTGYGCTREGGTGGNDGIFRTGKSTVRALPSGTNYDVITKGGAAVCFGDSGGAAYKMHSDGRRTIFGPNSRGNIKDTSLIPGINTQTFVTWANAWSKSNGNTRICGLHTDAEFCRTGGEAPLPDSKFEISGGPACIKGVVGPDYLSKKDAIVEEIQYILEKHR